MIDKIEIVTEFKHIQVRYKETLFNEQREQAGHSLSREVIECGDKARAAEIGGEVEAISKVVWNAELIKNWNAVKAASQKTEKSEEKSVEKKPAKEIKAKGPKGGKGKKFEELTDQKFGK